MVHPKRAPTFGRRILISYRSCFPSKTTKCIYPFSKPPLLPPSPLPPLFPPNPATHFRAPASASAGTAGARCAAPGSRCAARSSAADAAGSSASPAKISLAACAPPGQLFVFYGHPPKMASVVLETNPKEAIPQSGQYTCSLSGRLAHVGRPRKHHFVGFWLGPFGGHHLHGYLCPPDVCEGNFNGNTLTNDWWTL